MRTTEFVLGLIGGIFGFIGAILALFIGGVDAALNETGSSDVTGLGWAAFLFSALAIVGSVVVKSKAKVGGVLLLISAIGGLISISLFYAISAVLIGIAGLMALIKKDKENKMAA
ncbi:hypothetical protein J32TS6_40730 [Virgibacillus pantothenticus]|uniref:DUF4064 domain-containing protein n=1 Tax=Virgibacillus TaxID=84406 RepID=UPI00090B7851|nr:MULTISPECIES: DUF4064 domain-containing protein [Virgibacillus]API91705.1 hypothetical protein BKP57_07610 [Virgibacillus sp. 6R]MBS7427819.1 DUF4064 domain-containing protein [Virgibacillus sp. 19R1-5]GIP65518.1 hypothetical protein J32TS6_40730 [Virgibacillus pantothenticus]